MYYRNIVDNRDFRNIEIYKKCASRDKTVITIEEYFQIIEETDDNKCSREYLKSLTNHMHRQDSDVFEMMIKIHDDTFLSGTFPGNYALCNIIDFNKETRCRGRKFSKEGNVISYKSSPKMHDRISYSPKSTKRLLAEQFIRNRSMIYNFPHRLRELPEIKEKNKIILKDLDNNTEDVSYKSYFSKPIREMLYKMMTPQELSQYYMKVANVDIHEYTSKEFPIKIRMIGNDDGAIEGIYSTIEESEYVIYRSCLGGGWRSYSMQEYGLYYTD